MYFSRPTPRWCFRPSKAREERRQEWEFRISAHLVRHSHPWCRYVASLFWALGFGFAVGWDCFSWFFCFVLMGVFSVSSVGWIFLFFFFFETTLLQLYNGFPSELICRISCSRAVSEFRDFRDVGWALFVISATAWLFQTKLAVFLSHFSDFYESF